MSKQILVTGAAGFVGKHLVDHLARTTDANIFATDIEPEPPEWYGEHVGEQVKYRSGDVTDAEFLDTIFEQKYDRVYHFAAIVGVSEYVSNPLQIADVNIVATKEILERIKNSNVRFVFTSTSEIYGKNPDVPWGENDDRVLGAPTIDRWSYSTGKSACEHMIQGLAAADNPFTATIVRPFNLYGPGQRPNFAIPAFVEEVVNGGVPIVYDDGTQTRCFTYINDFVNGIIRASTRPEGENEAFNLGSTRETQIRDLADFVLEAADCTEREKEFVDTDKLYDDTYEDLNRRIPEVSKAKRRLDWEAETSLKEGLERTVKWGRANY